MIKYKKLADTLLQELDTQKESGIRTYSFLYRDNENNYRPYFNADYGNPKYPQSNLIKVLPFCPATHPRDYEYQRILLDYFTELFSYTALDNLHPLKLIDFTEIIIPQEKVNRINDLIDKNNLSDFRDFIFFLIAKIQKIYFEEIEYYQKGEGKKILNQFKVECRELIKVVTRLYEQHIIITHNPYPKLAKITFGFDKGDKKNIMIKDPMLLALIIKNISAFNPKEYHELTTDIGILPEIHFTPNHYNSNFKYKVAKTLHKFLSERTPLKPDINKQTSKKQVEFIAGIFELTEIDIRDIDGNIVPPGSEQNRIVRNWVKRGNALKIKGTQLA